MPGPLQTLVDALGLDDPHGQALEPDTLQVVAQRYPQFADALGRSQQDRINLTITGPNVIGPPDTVPQLSPDQMQQQLPPAAPMPQAPPSPSLFDRAGAYLSQGTVPRDLGQAYWQHGPQALGQGLSEAQQGVQQHLQGEVADPFQGPQWQHLPELSPALNKVMGGAGTTALAAAYPALLHPGMALVGGLAGMALTGGGQKTAEMLGADPETASLIGNVAGFIQPEHLAMAALPFAPYARNALTKVLGEVAEKRVASMLATNPALAPALEWLHPNETVALSKMTPASQAEFLRVHQAIPSNELLGALGRAGGEKLGWYEHSRAAIQHVYGDEADTFAGLLAATSPQNSVEMNLQNATNIFRGWVEAGRPTDRPTILRIMGENAVGDNGEKSVLDAWKNNTVEVLQGGKVISGPKVDSFWRNLRNRATDTAYGSIRPEDAMTLDAWMSNVLGVKQTYFSGKGASGKTAAAVKARMAQFAAANPGYGPGYLAATSRMREAATAAGMTPEQLQETIWSWGKALYEQSEKTKVSAVDIIRNGTLDPKAIAGTPDFSTLFRQPKYREAINNTSFQHAGRLATLKPATFPQTSMSNNRPPPTSDIGAWFESQGIRPPTNAELHAEADAFDREVALLRGRPQELSMRRTIQVPLEQIEHGESAMPGGKLTWPGASDLVNEYAARPTPLPPIEALPPEAPGDKWLVEDGSHRLEAARRRGDKTITVYADPAPPPSNDVQWQLEAAATLDKLRANRDLASDLRVGVNQPGTVGITAMQEGLSGLTTGVGPELSTTQYSQGQRDRFARQLLKPNTDVRGQNILMKALMGDTTESTVGIGRWLPKGKKKMQFNTLDAAGVRARYADGVVNQDDAERVLFAAHMQGLFDAQDAVATTGVVYDHANKDTLHVFTQNKVKQQTFEQLSKLFPDSTKYALANKGGGTPGHVIDVIRIDGQPLDAGDQATIQKFLDKQLRKPGEGKPKVDITEATNAGGSYHNLPWDSGENSQAVTKFAMRNYDNFTAAEKANLDSQAIKDMAAEKLRIWDAAAGRKKNPVTIRPDFRHMLELVAHGGVSSLRAALADPTQTLPSLLLIGLGESAFQSLQTPADRPSSPWQ